MDIDIRSISIEAEVTCPKCGTVEYVTVDEGDTYFTESQMIDAVVDSYGGCGWCAEDDDDE